MEQKIDGFDLKKFNRAGSVPRSSTAYFFRNSPAEESSGFLILDN
jgi:hypothetical protein